MSGVEEQQADHEPSGSEPAIPIAREAASTAMRLYSYHTHRQSMYALAAFLGIEFNISSPGLPRGAIPPATTIIFELHDLRLGDDNYTQLGHSQLDGTETGSQQQLVSIIPRDTASPTGRAHAAGPAAASSSSSVSAADTDPAGHPTDPPAFEDHFVVRAFVWHPCANPDTSDSYPSRLLPCPPAAARMGRVCPDSAGRGCTLRQLHAAIEKRVARTGSWAQLCDAVGAPDIRLAELRAHRDSHSSAAPHISAVPAHSRRLHSAGSDAAPIPAPHANALTPALGIAVRRSDLLELLVILLGSMFLVAFLFFAYWLAEECVNVRRGDRCSCCLGWRRPAIAAASEPPVPPALDPLPAVALLPVQPPLNAVHDNVA